MNNIFENAEFGYKFRTRYGRKAVLYRVHDTSPREHARYVEVLLEPNDDMIQGMHKFRLDGTAFDGHEYLDIVLY